MFNIWVTRPLQARTFFAAELRTDNNEEIHTQHFITFCLSI